MVFIDNANTILHFQAYFHELEAVNLLMQYYVALTMQFCFVILKKNVKKKNLFVAVLKKSHYEDQRMWPLLLGCFLLHAPSTAIKVQPTTQLSLYLLGLMARLWSFISQLMLEPENTRATRGRDNSEQWRQNNFYLSAKL